MKAVERVAETISWFPGHMYRAHKLMREKIKWIDVFIEVRDARVPLASKNIEIDMMLEEFKKPKIIIFNKYDLCNQRITNQYIENLKKAKIESIAVSAENKKNISKILGLAKSIKPIKYNTVGMWLMIGGMPNVGKSSIINALRKQATTLSHKDVTKATSTPCQTTYVTGFKINEDPLAFLVDTPGVMVPRITDQEVGLKLALVGCIRDKIVDKEILIQYLFEVLHKQKLFKYVEKYSMEKPCQNYHEVLRRVNTKYSHHNMEATYDLILSHFREGLLGKLTIDDITLGMNSAETR